jgi:Ala-tRNA(Pro) deacylase
MKMLVSSFLKRGRYDFERKTHAPAYDAQRLAHALHVSGHQVAKTVLLRAPEYKRLVLAVLPADKRVNLDRVSKLLGGTKVELATEFDMAEVCPDCEFGVLPPFGSRYGLRTIVDSELANHEFIWFEGNTHEEAIKLRFRDFCRLEQPEVSHLSE